MGMLKAVWIHNWINHIKCWVSLEFLLYVVFWLRANQLWIIIELFSCLSEIRKSPSVFTFLCRREYQCQQWMNSKWDYSCCMGFWYMFVVFSIHAIKIPSENGLGKLPVREFHFGKFIGRISQRGKIAFTVYCSENPHFQSSLLCWNDRKCDLKFEPMTAIVRETAWSTIDNPSCVFKVLYFQQCRSACYSGPMNFTFNPFYFRSLFCRVLSPLKFCC